MQRTALPKWCSWAIDRHGKPRIRFRKGALSQYLTAEPGTDEFTRQYYSALAGGVKDKATNIGADRTIPGSFNALCVAYYRSADFINLAPITQKNRRSVIEQVRPEHGHKPLARLEQRHIRELLQSKARTSLTAANALLSTVRPMLNFAVDIGMIPSNPALGIRPYRIKSDGFHTWTEDEVAQFEAHHPVGTRARLALTLLLYTAQRVADVIRMGRQHIQGKRIAVRQQKTGMSLLIPLHPMLEQVLMTEPVTNMTYLMTSYGKPFSANGFSHWFREQCDAAGLSQCSAHGLRKLAATRLANAGCTPAMIMAITGHRTLSEVQRYTEAANRERLAQDAIDKLGAKSEHELVQPAPTVGQKG
jgi:integrase